MSFSPKQPSSMIGTFGFVLIATMFKEALEDYSRYKQDKQSNDKLVLKHLKGTWEIVHCWTLKPGDIIKVLKEEEFTADCVIIKSSNNTGYCFIDTKNLDGETNLKEKCAIEEFKNINEKKYSRITGSIDSDKPDESITSWEGIISFNGMTIYSSLKNMILKGCVLKNTDYAIGIVVYSGANTKILKNSKQPRVKVSKILITMNTLLYSLFAFDIIVCIIFAILSTRWIGNDGINHNYIFPNYYDKATEKNTILRFIILFLTFFVGYSQIIPISLYVALEMVKIIQGILIYYDNDIYDVDLKKPAISRTTDLIEELGQVEFIFSDKTGTLTQNSMILKKCYVNKKIYGIIKEEEENKKFTINGDTTPAKKIMSFNENDEKDKECLLDFFSLLAICHSVFPEKTDRGIVYQGSSPDDVALVQGANQMGIEYINKDFNDLTIKNQLNNEINVWEQKAEMPFDSDRKRMSVIVRDKKSNKLMLLSKGADNVMFSDNRINVSPENLEEIDKVLNIFSKEGLRILVMAEKFLDEEYFEDWQERHNDARNKGQNLKLLYDEMECNLNFVGCSAIEDKLQDGVPEAIHTFLTCNIRIWVLTGDKQDTALEIAKSCMLIDENMHVLILSTDPDNVEEKLKEVMRELNLDALEEKQDIDLNEVSSYIRESLDKDLSVIIDGSTLEIVLNNYELSKIFFYISVAAKSVVCCRVSPKQKAKVVNLAKQYGPWITLGIGDGANDVPMIMEAHIGIGIQGKEGTQAVRSADYAIGQFKFLEKLLLSHGRNGYIKISRFICYYFYKNIILVVTEIFFALFNGFSGQIFFADYLGTMFNAFFTSWPCLFTFSLENDHDLNICKKLPILYKAGQLNYYFNLKEFWKYVIYAIMHSFFAFYIPMVALDKIVSTDGTVFNHWQISTVSFTLVINIVTLKLLIISNFWNIINLGSSVLSIGFYFLVLFVLCSQTFASNFQNEVYLN
jgi:phospholipid-transporting ATPase